MKNEIWRPLAELKKEKLWFSIVTRDRHGKVVSRERRKSHSFLKAWNLLVYVQMQTALSHIIKDTAGTNRTVGVDLLNGKMVAGATNILNGIRVGTGNTAVDISDFQLETPIVEGVGGGQMEHLICTVDTPVIAAPSCSFVVHRTIVNNSGGVITVREATIYMNGGGTPYYICATRDVLTAPQAVPNGGSITIDWTIGVTI